MKNIKKLTIGIMHYGSYCSAHSTIQSIRLHHSEILKEIEFIILDSHPTETETDVLANSIASEELVGIPVRYIAEYRTNGTAAKHKILNYVNTPYFLYIEPSTLLIPGSLKKLIDFFESKQDHGFGILQGVEMDFSLENMFTHKKFVWNNHKYGILEYDSRILNNTCISVAGARTNTFACRMETIKNINLFSEYLVLNSLDMDDLYCDTTLRKNKLLVGCISFLKYTASKNINAYGRIYNTNEYFDTGNLIYGFVLSNKYEELTTAINIKKSMLHIKDIKQIIEYAEMDLNVKLQSICKEIF